jgi:lipoprotein-anchoring transpeptidase ErfK/SrfK
MRLSRLISALAVCAVAALFAAPAWADVLISVDKSTQTMSVMVDGAVRYIWPVSTGAPGYDTPSGDFKPFRMEEDHFSKEWDDAPMPHSIFFTMQGHAIHGSSHKSIGRPASHGCVRLEPKNATILFALVKQQKMANTRVVLTGNTPQSTDVPVARRDANPAQRRAGAEYGQPSPEYGRSSNDYERTFSNTDSDPDYTGTVQPQQRTVIVRRARPYDEAQRYYYDADSPYYTGQRRYRVQQDFGWPFGR